MNTYIGTACWVISDDDRSYLYPATLIQAQNLEMAKQFYKDYLLHEHKEEEWSQEQDPGLHYFILNWEPITREQFESGYSEPSIWEEGNDDDWDEEGIQFKVWEQPLITI